jgi:hypothetical protein
MHVINLAPNSSCIRFGTGPLDPTIYLETNVDQERADKNQQKRIQTLFSDELEPWLRLATVPLSIVSSRKYLLGVTVSYRGKEIENRYLKTLKRVESSSRSRGNKFNEE